MLGELSSYLVELVRDLELDVHISSFRQRGEVARAETLADFLKDGAVFDERDDDLESYKVAVGHVPCHLATACNAVCSAADHGEEGCGVFPGDLDAGEILEDFEDTAAWAGCIVVEFVGVHRIGEVEQALSVQGVVGVVGDQLEEVALGDGSDVEIVEQEFS